MSQVEDAYFSLFNSMNRHGIRYLVVGGIAMLYYGSPRLTIDIDIVVDSKLDQSKAWSLVTKEQGLFPRKPISFQEYYNSAFRLALKGRNLSSQHTLVSQSGTPVLDIIFDPPWDFRRAYGRRNEYTDGDLIIPVVSRMDLIQMKSTRGRDKDFMDIEFLQRTAGNGDT